MRARAATDWRVLDGRGNVVRSSEQSRVRPQVRVPEVSRRWESAKTHRLNESHWGGALGGANINEDLQAYLPTIRRRANYEVANNPTLAGVISTYGKWVIGAHGPKLQLRTKDRKYAELGERLWRAKWKKADARGKLSGVQMLHQNWHSYCTNGEWLNQMVTGRDGLPSLMPHEVTRLDSPQAGALTVMGIDFDEIGRPLRYWLQDGAPVGTQVTFTFKAVDAKWIIHGFRETYPHQARGIPLFAISLDKAADLRDYEQSVQIAMRNAAEMSAYMQAAGMPEYAQADFMEIDEEIELEPGTIKTLPPWYDVKSLPTTQPGAQYTDFVRARHAEFGRPIDMPVMMVDLDSSKHNYSSARFDAQGFYRTIDGDQQFLSDIQLDPYADVLFAEAELMGLLPAPPDDLEREWIWPRPPHVDPDKEAKGTRQRLDNGELTPQRMCLEQGRDLEEVVQEWDQAQQMFEAAGLPFPYLQSMPGAVTKDEVTREKDEKGEE